MRAFADTRPPRPGSGAAADNGDAAAYLNGIFAGMMAGRRPVVPDTSVWAEMRGWGFDRFLRLRLIRPVTGDADDGTDAPAVTLAEPAVTQLRAAFSHTLRSQLAAAAASSDSDGAVTAAGASCPAELLTWRQLNVWRAQALGVPAFRRMLFARVAVRPAGMPALGSGMEAARRGVVGPEEYGRLLNARFGLSRDDELRTLFDKQGMSSRLCHRDSRVLARAVVGAVESLPGAEAAGLRPRVSLHSLFAARSVEVFDDVGEALRGRGLDWLCPTTTAQPCRCPCSCMVVDRAGHRAAQGGAGAGRLLASSSSTGVVSADAASRSSMPNPLTASAQAADGGTAAAIGMVSPVGGDWDPAAGRRGVTPASAAASKVAKASKAARSQGTEAAEYSRSRAGAEGGVLRRQLRHTAPFALNQRLLAMLALCLVFCGAGAVLAILSEARFRRSINTQYDRLVGARLVALSRAVGLADASREKASAVATTAASFAANTEGMSVNDAVEAALGIGAAESASAAVAQACGSAATGAAAAADAASAVPGSEAAATAAAAAAREASGDAAAAASAVCGSTGDFVTDDSLRAAVEQATRRLDELGLNPTAAADLASRAQTLARGGAAAALESAGISGEDAQRLGEFATQFLVGVDVDSLGALKDELVDILLACSSVAVVVALLTVAANAALMVRSYRRTFMDALQGRYRLVWEKNHVAKASTFLGIAAASSLLTFLGVWLAVTLVGFSLAFTPVRDVVLAFALTTLSALVGVSLAVTVAQFVVMQLCLSRGSRVLYRRLFMVGDFFLSLANLFSGFFVSVVRLGVAVAVLFLNFMRLDQPLVNQAMEHLDPATAAFNAVLILDVLGSHPIFVAFTEALTLTLKRNRAAARRHQVLARAEAEAAGDGTGALSRLGRVANAAGLPRAGSPASDPVWDDVDAASEGSAGDSSGRRSLVGMMWLAVFLATGPPSLRDMRDRDDGFSEGAAGAPGVLSKLRTSVNRLVSRPRRGSMEPADMEGSEKP